MDYQWHDLLGNVGVAMILGSYLLVQVDRLDVRTIRYSVLNGLGAAFITISLLFDFNLSAFVIELAWFLISCYGLLRRLRLGGGGGAGGVGVA